MNITPEMMAEDERMWGTRDVITELGYCGNYMCDRKTITNLDIRFYAYIMRKAHELLKEQEARVIELSEISPDIYVWLEDRDDGTVFPLKGGVIDPDGDEYFRFDADFGEDFVYYPTGPFGKHWRVWDKCPTPEQMRDMPWEGENETM